MKHVEFWPGCKHEGLPALIKAENLAAAGPGRRREACRSRQPLPVVLLSRLGIQAADDSRLLLKQIQAIGWRRPAKRRDDRLASRSKRRNRSSCCRQQRNIAAGPRLDRRNDAALACQPIGRANIQQVTCGNRRWRAAAARRHLPQQFTRSPDRTTASSSRRRQRAPSAASSSRGSA